MCPCFSINDVRHGHLAHMKVLRYLPLVLSLFVSLANFAYNVGVHVAALGGSAFYSLVGHVVLVRSNGQVLWVYATWIVAGVQNLKRFIEGSVGKLVGNAVCKCKFAVPNDTAVAIVFFFANKRSCPKYTSSLRCFANVHPKSHFNWPVAVPCGLAWPGAKSAVSFLYFVFAGKELFFALFALPLNLRMAWHSESPVKVQCA